MISEGFRLKDLEIRAEGARAWGLELRSEGEPLVGPLGAFRLRSPTLTVTVLPPDVLPEGPPSRRAEVVESAGSFLVDYFAFDDYAGLLHHGGGNWVFWSPDLGRVFVTADRSWPTTWVHVRFLLRHFIVSGLLTRPHHHCIHAVVAVGPMSSGPRRGLLVAGPSGSGKTRLVNRLVERGVVSAVVEDDCAVIDSGWGLISLMPTEHELRRPQHLEVAAVVLLDTDATAPEAVSPRAAADFAARCPTPWPARWLPGATSRHSRMGDPPPELRALRVPARCDTDDAVLEAVAQLTASAVGL